MWLAYSLMTLFIIQHYKVWNTVCGGWYFSTNNYKTLIPPLFPFHHCKSCVLCALNHLLCCVHKMAHLPIMLLCYFYKLSHYIIVMLEEWKIFIIWQFLFSLVRACSSVRIKKIPWSIQSPGPKQLFNLIRPNSPCHYNCHPVWLLPKHVFQPPLFLVVRLL